MLSMFVFVKITMHVLCYEPAANFGCLFILICSHLHVSIEYSIMLSIERNWLELGSLKHQFFLAVLKLPVRDSFD